MGGNDTGARREIIEICLLGSASTPVTKRWLEQKMGQKWAKNGANNYGDFWAKYGIKLIK